MALVSADKFAELCPNVAASLSSAQIAAHVAAAESAAARYVGRRLESCTETVTLDGTGHPELPLPVWPVQSVSAVYLDTGRQFAASSLLTLGTDYLWSPGDTALTLLRASLAWPVGTGTTWGFRGLSRPGGSWVGWPRLPKIVRVTYSAGYTASDADLVQAICQIAAYAATVTESGGLVAGSNSFIDVSEGGYSFITEALSRGTVPAIGSARQVLDSIREVRLPVTLF